MSRTLVSVLLLATLGSGFAMPVLGDDWVASKLRGVVLTLVDGQWVKLERGQTVPDDRVIRTLKTGRVVFQRGPETIELGGDTQVQIFDRTGKRFTTVKQYFGTVGVEAEVQNVQHFAVQTPYLAAVVKGTKFVVTSDEDGARVDVTRGHVAVEDRDTRQSTLVAAGQSAETSAGTPLEISGDGDLPDIVDSRGKVVAAVASTTTTSEGGTRVSESEGKSNGKSEERGGKSSGSGNSGESNGRSGESNGKSEDSNGDSEESDDESDDNNGKSDESHGKSDESHGKSDESHGKSDESRGKSKKDD
jgi:FecR protein